MGFFTKLKNTLTGGWAKIKIECDGGLRGDEIQVVVRAFVGAEPIDIDRVYLKVRSFEEVEIPQYQFQKCPRSNWIALILNTTTTAM